MMKYECNVLLTADTTN